MVPMRPERVFRASDPHDVFLRWQMWWCRCQSSYQPRRYLQERYRQRRERCWEGTVPMTTKSRFRPWRLSWR